MTELAELIAEQAKDDTYRIYSISLDAPSERADSFAADLVERLDVLEDATEPRLMKVPHRLRTAKRWETVQEKATSNKAWREQYTKRAPLALPDGAVHGWQLYKDVRYRCRCQVCKASWAAHHLEIHQRCKRSGVVTCPSCGHERTMYGVPSYLRAAASKRCGSCAAQARWRAA